MNTIKIYSNDMITKASYGILDRYTDVFNILKDLLEKSTSPFIVSSKLFNFDPYFGKIKELNIVLQSNKQLKIKDNTYLEYEYVQVEVKEIETIQDIQMHILHDKIDNIIKVNNNSSPLNYIVSTNARDENNILEWIIYHLLIGFDRVVIIDHRSVVPIKQLIEPYHWKHKVEVIRNEMEGPVKMHFLNKIIIPYMMKYCRKYFIHLDADEYIYIKDNLTIDKLLVNYNNCNILSINWLMFGNNNVVKNEHKNKCAIPTFTKSDKSIHNHFKCFIRVDKNIHFSYVNPHHVLLQNMPSTYTNIDHTKSQFTGDPIKHFEESCPSKCLNEIPCYIAHYVVQSQEDYFHRKINRNRDDIEAKRENDLEVFSHHNDINNTDLVYYSDTINYMLENINDSDSDFDAEIEEASESELEGL